MKEHSKFRINYKWLSNSNTKKKSEQVLEVEGVQILIQNIMDDINKAASFVTKKVDKLKGRDSEVKSIMEDFVIDVYSSTDLE